MGAAVAAGVALLIGLAAGLIAFRESPPLVFVVLCVVALVVDLAFLGLLAHPDTTEFIRGSWLVHHDRDPDGPDRGAKAACLVRGPRRSERDACRAGALATDAVDA